MAGGTPKRFFGLVKYLFSIVRIFSSVYEENFLNVLVFNLYKLMICVAKLRSFIKNGLVSIKLKNIWKNPSHWVRYMLVEVKQNGIPGGKRFTFAGKPSLLFQMSEKDMIPIS